MLKEPKYEIGEFTNELRKEVSSKSEFGINILNQINQENGKLKKETQKRIWKQVLTNPRNCEILLLKFYNSKEVFEILKESLNELSLECEKVLNFFLDAEIVEKKAKTWSEKFSLEESFNRNEFVEKIMNREKIRLEALKEVSDLFQVINLNSSCSEDEIEMKLFDEMKK